MENVIKMYSRNPEQERLTSFRFRLRGEMLKKNIWSIKITTFITFLWSANSSSHGHFLTPKTDTSNIVPPCQDGPIDLFGN